MKTMIVILFTLLGIILVSCTPIPSPTLTPTRTTLPTKTPTPTPTATITLSPTPTAIPLHPAGKVHFHESNENIQYNWFSYLPARISKEEPLYIWVNSVNGFYPPSDDYKSFTDEARLWINDSRQPATSNNLVSLIPIIPRPSTNHVYAVAFDWKVFLPSSDPFVQHPEKQVNLMIDKLIDDLSHDGYNVQDKVFIEGFSAGCMFAQRYTIIHPERVKAMAGEQCGGSLVMPFQEIDGEKVNWPLGINDFESLLGFQFDEGSYKEVPHFIYIGDKDVNNSTFLFWGPGELWKSWGQINKLKRLFGELEPEIIENQVEYLIENGFPLFEYKIYSGVSHRYTLEMQNDAKLFFNQFK